MNEQEILNEISKLDVQHKLDIVQHVLQMLNNSDKSLSENIRHHKLIELKGLGKNIWTKTNANDFVREERQAWS